MVVVPDSPRILKRQRRSILRSIGHLNSLKNGDYFALLAYIQWTKNTKRRYKRSARPFATTPRFLHSIGQAYKGGPNTGVFLQITAEDLEVPGQKYTLGVVKAAPARGDLEVLVERGRRALRIHLGSDVRAGFQKLAAAVGRALHS